MNKDNRMVFISMKMMKQPKIGKKVKKVVLSKERMKNMNIMTQTLNPRLKTHPHLHQNKKLNKNLKFNKNNLNNKVRRDNVVKRSYIHKFN